MKIEKAIEILTSELSLVRGIGTQSRIDAIKLGIEALKCVKEIRHHPFPESVLQLPGETEE